MSLSSYSSQRRCRCGINAKQFTSTTPSNPGRKFFKCARDGKIDSCGYWEWDDEVISDRVDIVIQNLKFSLDKVRSQRDKLKQKIEVLEAKNAMEVKKSFSLEAKVSKMEMFMVLSWGLFIGFDAVFLLK